MFRVLVGSECSDVDAVLAKRVSLSTARAMRAKELTRIESHSLATRKCRVEMFDVLILVGWC
jgi:hypothetical protein